MTPILGPEAQSCWDPPFPTLRLSRLNDLPGNLSASQFEDAILAAFNAAKTAQARESQGEEGWFTPADLRQVQLSGLGPSFLLRQ